MEHVSVKYVCICLLIQNLVCKGGKCHWGQNEGIRMWPKQPDNGAGTAWCTSQKLQLFKQLQMYLSSSCIWNLSLSSVGCTSKKFSLIVFGCRSVCYHILNIILVFEIFGNLHLPHCSRAVSTRTACHSEFYAWPFFRCARLSIMSPLPIGSQ